LHLEVRAVALALEHVVQELDSGFERRGRETHLELGVYIGSHRQYTRKFLDGALQMVLALDHVQVQALPRTPGPPQYCALALELAQLLVCSDRETQYRIVAV
jgi:hypothetical protein